MFNSTYNQTEDKGTDSVPNLRRDVGAELLQRGQESFELAELACPAGRGQLLTDGRVHHGANGGRGRCAAVDAGQG